MDYKEKLRLAKEALESGSYDKETIEYIFPELKENEDEKVRNKLIEFFKGYYPDKEWWGNITQKDILAWFEKQGEQKHAEVKPKFKVGDIIRNIDSGELFHIEKIDSRNYWDGRDSFYIINQEQWEHVEQKSSWSEEDEMQLDAAIHLVNNTGHIETANWLKDLKNRVLPQPKQEWSEEDESWFDEVWSCISKEYPLANSFIFQWFKSLKDRYTWMPTKEQIYSLDRVLQFYGKGTAIYDSVKELLEQLKKL